MKRYNFFVNIFITSLIFTNIWINGYISLLSILNERFLSGFKVSSNLLIEVTPEPFEIPLYIFMAVIMTIIIIAFFKKLTLYFSKKSSPTKLLLFFLFLSLFIFRLGQYPMIEEFTLKTFVKATLYISAIILVIFISKLVLRKTNKEKFGWMYYVFIFMIIAFFLFEPRFPIGPSDYTYFLGPVYEVSSGKTIYTDVSSQYGFLSVLFFSFLSNLLSPLIIIPYFVWLLLSLGYFLCFRIFYGLSRSITLSLIGLFSIITINYYSLIHLGLQNPQNPLRWPILIMAVFLFYKIHNIRSKVFIFLISLLSFWIVDSGIELILAFGFTLFISFLTRKINFQQAIFTLFYFFLNIFLIFQAINLLHILLGYAPINAFLVFEKLREFAQAGFYMVAMEPTNFFWIIILFYVASIIFYLRNKDSKEGELLVFSANISLFVSLYFVGRSISHNLFHILPFAILNIFILFSIIYHKLNLPKARILLFFIFILFITIPVYSRQQAISDNIRRKIEKMSLGNIFVPEINSYILKFYRNEVNLIKKIPEKDLVILSPDDTYLFYLTEKYNLLNANPQMTLYSIKEIDQAINNILACPKTMIISCSAFKKNCAPDINVPRWYKKTQPILIGKIEDKCGKYSPSVCTDKLCVSISGLK